MPNKDFKFNLREPSGSMGDFGTLFPLVIGLVYRLPMPVEPKKIVAAAAIAQRWPTSLVYASGLGLGITWFILVLTGLMRRIVRWTPSFIVRGFQLALGIMLAWEGIKMI
jgi:SulP family sulfate permease